MRLDAGDTKYRALLTELGELHDVPACASRLGVCMRLPTDGFMCDGQCRWKPRAQNAEKVRPAR